MVRDNYSKDDPLIVESTQEDDTLNIKTLRENYPNHWWNEGTLPVKVVYGSDGLNRIDHISLSQWLVRLMLTSPNPKNPSQGRERGIKIKEMKDAVIDTQENAQSSPLDTPQSSSPAAADREASVVKREAQQDTKYASRDTSDEVGGIDMNSIDLGRQGAGVDIQFDPAELQDLIKSGIDGFAPIIINIVPLPSVLPLLGLEPTKEEDMEELSRLN